MSNTPYWFRVACCKIFPKNVFYKVNILGFFLMTLPSMDQVFVTFDPFER